MKVYVDKNEYYRITYSSRDGRESLESMGMQPIIVENLADYKKQVRKQVCDEIREKLTNNDYILYGESKKPIVNLGVETLVKILDQIEKGE